MAVIDLIAGASRFLPAFIVPGLPVAVRGFVRLIGAGRLDDHASAPVRRMCFPAWNAAYDTNRTMTLSAGQALILRRGKARIVLLPDGSITLDGTSLSNLATRNVRTRANRTEQN